ncbi:hypothetical protein TNCV_262041 [Trichonephila clavipes]|nr:hypothetical protein TNCV_262041 [Trichonephila clavipes]
MATNQILDINNVMDLSLPSSTETSRPGTPRKQTANGSFPSKTILRNSALSLKIRKQDLKPYSSQEFENDPTILDHNRRLEEYQRLQQLAVSEFTSQPFCNTPGCTIHHTP